MPLDEEAQRAETEAAFREANERIRDADRRLEPPLERVPYLCECDDVDCREQIRLTRAEYEAVRRDSTLFAVVPGHSSQGEAVAEHPHFVLVRKSGVAADVARARDPREARDER